MIKRDKIIRGTVKMTVEEAILQAKKILKENNIEDEAIIARLLMQKVLNKEHTYIIINYSKKLTNQEEQEYKKGLQMLLKGYPIQYITNKQEFMGLQFYVDENVLIPQPDTEILVEETIKLLKEKQNIQILDLCTGSGCIAIAIAKYLKSAKVIAIDISKKALEIAQKNSKINEVEEKIQFMQSDLWQEIKKQAFDIIVSNPPYIETENIQKLSKQVQKEPLIALDGGKDGLEFYRKIIKEAPNYLKEDGYLCLEIGYNQKKQIINEMLQTKDYKYIVSKKDLAGNDRVIIGGMQKCHSHQR